MLTLRYLKWLTKDLFYSTWNSTQRYVAGWMGEEFGGEWMSPFAVRLKLSQHCLLIGYTPAQNKKVKIKNSGVESRADYSFKHFL